MNITIFELMSNKNIKSLKKYEINLCVRHRWRSGKEWIYVLIKCRKMMKKYSRKKRKTVSTTYAGKVICQKRFFSDNKKSI
jgi:hypothetical protein